MDRGMISKMFDWVSHPSFTDEGTPQTWVAGLVVILCAAYLWSRVVKQVIE